jgi:hypothetical protein
MICHGSFRCDERRSLKTGWIVAHTRSRDYADDGFQRPDYSREIYDPAK